MEIACSQHHADYVISLQALWGQIGIEAVHRGLNR